LDLNRGGEQGIINIFGEKKKTFAKDLGNKTPTIDYARRREKKGGDKFGGPGKKMGLQKIKLQGMGPEHFL